MTTLRLLRDGAVVISSLAISILLAELLARVYLFGLSGLSYHRVDSVHNTENSGLIQPAAVRELIYEFKPNVDDYLKTVRLRTNSQGLREDKEYSFEKPNDVYRVAVIGDSFSMPTGVELEDSYFKILEKRLNAENRGKRFEFINFSVGAYSLRQYAAAIEHKALKYNPDLILLGWCAENDHESYPDHAYVEPYRVKPRTSLFYESFILKLVKSLMIAKTIHEPAHYSPQDIAYIEKMLARIKKQIGNTPMLIAYLGLWEKRGPEVGALARKYGFDFVDTVPAFEAVNYSKYIIYRLDPHPNWRANKKFADVIYDFF